MAWVVKMSSSMARLTTSVEKFVVVKMPLRVVLYPDLLVLMHLAFHTFMILSNIVRCS